jgi:tetratricopeptide (TPR) repeat protein
MDQFIRGTTADEMEDYYRAVFHYQEALRYDSSSAFIQVALAQDYILLGNVATASDLLDKALKTHPDFLPALELKAIIMRGTGKLDQAEVALKTLVRLAPKKTDYLRQLLAVELGLKHYDEGERLYKQIVAISGDSETLTRQVLGAYLAAGQRDRAIGLLQKLVVEDTTDANLVYTLGTLYFQKGDTTSGEKLILKANNMAPEDIRFWIGRALIAADRHDYPSVVSVVDSALQHVKGEAPLYSLKGVALARLPGRTPEAIQTLQTAISMDSTAVVAMGQLALLYDGMDSVSQAAELYERAIRLSDSAAVYLNNLAYTYAARGLELDKAYTLVDRALKAEPKNSSYLDTMGWIEYGRGRFKEALKFLRKAADQDRGNSTVNEHIGDVYQKMGEHDKALKFYRKALSLDPGNEQLREKAR